MKEIYKSQSSNYYLCYETEEKKAKIETDGQAELFMECHLLFGIGYTEEQAREDFENNSVVLKKRCLM